MRCTLMNIAAFLAMTLFMASCFADDAPALTDAESAVENTEQTEESENQLPTEDTEAEQSVEEAIEEESVDSEAYPVPENGTPAEYLAFIGKLMLVERPKDQTQEEMIDHYTKLCKAQIAAADKVIEHKDATVEQILRCVAVKIRSLQILIKAGDKDAKSQLYSMPIQLEKAGYSQIADDIAMRLINLAIQEAKATNDYSEIEKIIEQTDLTIKKTPAENKEKLQRLYLVKLICIKGLGQLKGEDNSADFDAVVAEIKEAGLSEMVEDIFMGKLVNALSESIALNDKTMFDKTAKAIDDMIADYGEKANLKVAAVAFQTAFTEEVFDADAAASRYEKYANAFEKIEDAKVQEIVKMMRGAAKRLTLKGKELPITGKTIDGSEFKMADQKDKKVLVYFWSPSVRPSMDEFNYLMRAYPVYKAKGFEVVCIALDGSAKNVAAIAKHCKFPWINMMDQDAQINGVTVSQYYGIVAIPCMILVEKNGLVSASDVNVNTLIANLNEEFGELTEEQIAAFDDIDFNELDELDEEENADDNNSSIEEAEDVLNETIDDANDEDVNIEEGNGDVEEDAVEEGNLDIEGDDVTVEESNLDIEGDDNLGDAEEDDNVDLGDAKDDFNIDEDDSDVEIDDKDVDIQDDDVDF